MLDEGQKRRALNEDLFRKVNEQVEGLNERLNDTTGLNFNVVCECDRLDCVEQLPVSPDAYRATRADARRFLIAPDHDDRLVEEVVVKADRYWIVQKHAGVPAAIAEALDS
ncbi:MAG: hypothetical protein QOG69_1652 [Actinomycetota bacterium]|nr:hypothetical protein [Actinomycetota bacterium]